MAFMQREITEKQSWYQVESDEGMFFIPTSVVGRIPEMHVGVTTGDDRPLFYEVLSRLKFFIPSISTVDYIGCIEGYGARLSAPGYLDWTEWAVFDTIEEAQMYLDETYPEEEEEES